MGFNTVMMVLNDTVDVGAKDPEIGQRIRDAVISWSSRDRDPGRCDIYARSDRAIASYASVISQAHADYSQVVVVGRNCGAPIVECNELDHYALGQIADALRRHGWTVKPPSKKRKLRVNEP